jgi:hypothetical protein
LGSAVEEVDERAFLVGASGEGGRGEEQGMEIVVTSTGIPEGGMLQLATDRKYP